MLEYYLPTSTPIYSSELPCCYCLSLTTGSLVRGMGHQDFLLILQANPASCLALRHLLLRSSSAAGQTRPSVCCPDSNGTTCMHLVTDMQRLAASAQSLLHITSLMLMTGATAFCQPMRSYWTGMRHVQPALRSFRSRLSTLIS